MKISESKTHTHTLQNLLKSLNQGKSLGIKCLWKSSGEWLIVWSLFLFYDINQITFIISITQKTKSTNQTRPTWVLSRIHVLTASYSQFHHRSMHIYFLLQIFSFHTRMKLIQTHYILT